MEKRRWKIYNEQCRSQRHALGTVKGLWLSFSVKMLIHLWGYICIALSIFLGNHFKFKISHFSETYVYGYPQAYLGSYQTSMMSFFAKFEQIQANWSQNSIVFCKIWWRICTLITSKVHNLNLELPSLGFYEHTIFHTADSTWLLTLWLV